MEAAVAGVATTCWLRSVAVSPSPDTVCVNIVNLVNLLINIVNLVNLVNMVNMVDLLDMVDLVRGGSSWGRTPSPPVG